MLWSAGNTSSAEPSTIDWSTSNRGGAILGYDGDKAIIQYKAVCLDFGDMLAGVEGTPGRRDLLGYQVPWEAGRNTGCLSLQTTQTRSNIGALVDRRERNLTVDGQGAKSESTTARLVLVRNLVHLAIEQSRISMPVAASALLPMHDAVELFLHVAANHFDGDKMRGFGADFDKYFQAFNAKLAPEQLSGLISMRRLNAARAALKH